MEGDVGRKIKYGVMEYWNNGLLAMPLKKTDSSTGLNLNSLADGPRPYYDERDVGRF
jgi:hypothetical protein